MTKGGEFGLDVVLDALREDLESAWLSSQGKRVRFRAAEVTVMVETVARRDAEGSGKIRWYVVEAGGGVKSGSEHTQTLTLKLTPLLYDDQGKPEPLEVYGQQPNPGH